MVVKDLKQRTTLVTGSSRGIGAAIARELADRGAQVIIHGRHRESVEAMVATIHKHGGRAVPLTGDVTQWDELLTMRHTIENEVGPLSTLVVNAGGSFSPPIRLTDISLEDWQQNIDGNLTATFLTLKCFLPVLSKQTGSSAVTIASSAGRHIEERAPLPYAVAKAGVIHLTQLAARQYGPVRINCVAPETVLTEDNRKQIPQAHQQSLADMHPLKQLGTPEDVARTVAFLVSDEASWISGSVVDVTGGMTW